MSADRPPPLNESPFTFPWRRNLVVVWISQFLSVSGFAFGIPLLGLYIQELGVESEKAIGFWTAALQGGAAVSLALMSPVWGALGDRYGRKMMLLRANFGGAVCLFGMSLAGAPGHLLFLRMFQGVFTGTIPAAQTLVSVHTPEHRQGFALGLMASAVQAGIFNGRLVGGYAADLFGFAAAFQIGSGLLIASALLIILFVREDFSPPDPREAAGEGTRRGVYFASALPVFLLMIGASFALRMDQPFIPIFIKDIFMGGVMEGSPSLAGQLGAVDAVASILAGLIVSHSLDRLHGRRIGAVAAFIAAAAAVYIGAAARMPQVYGGRFVYMLCAGGMYPLLIMWTSRLIPPAIRGRYFGLTLTARSIGWVIGPFVAGGIYGYLGPREIFYAGAGAWVLVGGLFLLLGPRVPGPAASGSQEKNSPLAEEGRSG